VLNQMDKDLSRRQGVWTMQAKIAFDTEQHLPWDFVSDIMHTHNNEGFTFYDPSSKKIFWVAKIPISIHKHWAGDGYDKLYKIGFLIWAVVDDATGKWLSVWVIPSNRMGYIIRYLFLCLVELFGGEFVFSHFHDRSLCGVRGIPLQFTTDCGSETTQLHGLANALQSVLHY